MYVLHVLIYGDNGIPRDLLDVCFGDQLAGSVHEPMHRGWHAFLSSFSGRTLGHSLRSFALVE